MLNLLTGIEADILLHATVLALGCATFFGVILCSRCPDCGWHEWVSGRGGEGEKE